MFTRYASAISTSTIMTLGLIYIMHTLIAIQPGVMVDARHHHVLGRTKLNRDDDPPRTRDMEIDRQRLVETVLPPKTRFTHHGLRAIGVPSPAQTVTPNTLPTSFGPSDGPLVTMFNVQPIYPARALQRGIEGYVIVEFDVDANGRAINIRVVETSNQIFNGAAIKAAERIKFKSRVVDGQPVATANVQKLFRFDIEDE